MGASRQVPANRGLHLIDVNPATGKLFDIAGQQRTAYEKGNTK